MTNHLAAATSPYLKQHANNPVDWYPWNNEAIEKAKKENKPILLSIGYAACHWCHVMAHESFEDNETAKIMNRDFINIKVDKEERPDLDKIYQTCHYVLTQQSGGWPLTLFLSPHDLTPFFSGTYFPREAKHQLPAFKEILKTIADIYKNQSAEISQQNERVGQVLNYPQPVVKDIALTQEPLEYLHQAVARRYDKTHGGFGEAPKFFHTTLLEILINEKSPIALHTLKAMAEGGIYDQLEGGFFRYSVDASWRIPHFEKMLYDNAQLLYLYAIAYKQFNEPLFAEIVRSTADWIIKKMENPEGGYYSTLDADSEGKEGKYYAWNKFEIEKLLSPEEYKIIRLHFGLNNTPNFEKQWHLYVAQSSDAIANELKMPLNEVIKIVDNAKSKLLAARELRIHPARDNKILTAWNSLMIKGMLTAGQILQEDRFIQSANKALQFIEKNLLQQERLLVSYMDGKAYLPGFIDDYAFFLEALLTYLQYSSDNHYQKIATTLADDLLKHFFDSTTGYFYFTSNDQEKIVFRPKTLMDEALPSGSGVAVRCLLAMKEPRYLEAAQKTLVASWPALMQFPMEHGSLLMALGAKMGKM